MSVSLIRRIDWNKIPEAQGVLDKIVARYKKGILNIIKFIGLPGSSKSWSGIRLAELVSQEIHGHSTLSPDYLVNSLGEFAKAVRTADKQGKIIVIEEMEVLFSNRGSMTTFNRQAINIFDVVRKKRMIIIGNFPINNTVDKHIMMMCNMQLTALQLDKQIGIAVFKPIILQTNAEQGKQYPHSLIGKDGRDIRKIYLRKPAEENSTPYEKRKDSNIEKVMIIAERKSLKAEEKQNKELGIAPKKKLLKALPPEWIQAYQLYTVGGETLEAIGKKYGVSYESIRQRLKKVEANTNLIT